MGPLVLVMIVLGPFGPGDRAGESDLRAAAASSASETSTSTGPAPTLPVPTLPDPTGPVPTGPVPTGPVPTGVPEEKPRPMTSETIDYERPGAPPQVPAGVTVEVQLASMTLAPGQPIEATVRIRNATSKKFYILEGCGVTFVEVINPEGDLVGRSPGEPCGSPGYYFKSAIVAGRGSGRAGAVRHGRSRDGRRASRGPRRLGPGHRRRLHLLHVLGAGPGQGRCRHALMLGVAGTTKQGQRPRAERTVASKPTRWRVVPRRPDRPLSAAWLEGRRRRPRGPGLWPGSVSAKL